MNLLSGANIVKQVLCEMNVKQVFGYVGNNILPILDTIYDSDIKLVNTLSEISACHAADGFSRAGNGIGVVLATSGPGALNLLTGIATANLDSIPLVAITGNIPLHDLGKDGFQETDIAGSVTPISKYSHIVKNVDELEAELKRAFYIASEGRGGAVLIDIPFDIQNQMTTYKNLKISDILITKKKIESRYSIRDIINEINKAKSPIIIAGGGIVDKATANKVVELANKIGAPIFATLRGVDKFKQDEPYLGMIGINNKKSLNFLKKFDLIIALGTRLSHRSLPMEQLGMHQKLVQIDIDIAEIEKRFVTEKYVVARVEDVIGKMIVDVCEMKREVLPFTADKIPLRVGKIFNAINNALSEDIYIVTDVGEHQIYAAKYVKHQNANGFLTSSGMGTMGFGLGAAIGAAVNGKKVFLITGDGSLNMNFTEIVTARTNNLNLTVLVMNNHSLKMVEKVQNKTYKKRYIGTQTPDIDYVRVAKALGIECQKSTVNKLEKHLQSSFSKYGVKLIEINC